MQALPTPTALRMFLEAARTESFVEAAATLNVTPAAVSKQIATLESRLGARLFERSHRSVSLTAAGRSYGPVAERVLALLEDGRDEAVSYTACEKLSIEVDHEFLDFILVPRLERLRRELPDVDIQFVPEATGRHGPRCDLAITYGHPGERGSDIERLCGFTVFAVGKPSLVESVAAPLSQLPLLHDVDTYWWRALLSAEGVIRKDAGIVLGHGAISIRAAIAGIGLSVGDNLLCAGALQSGALVRVGSAQLPGRADYWLSVHPVSPSRKVAQRFRGWLRNETSGF